MRKVTKRLPLRGGYVFAKWSGNLSLFLYPEPGAYNGYLYTSTSVPTGFTDGSTHFVRVTWRQSDKRVQFFESFDDGETWAQIGSDRSINVPSINPSTEKLLVAGNRSGTSHMAQGKFYYMELKNGIGGDTVAKFNASTGTNADRTDEYGNVWSVNGANSSWVLN